jgi:hypothetical protein
MATARIIDFLKTEKPDGPCLVVDLDVVRDNYKAFARSMPGTRIFYAVKANPAPEILKLLADEGSCFDTASVAEAEMALAAGATPDRISFGNTIKKERDVARAYELGIRLFAVDCETEALPLAAKCSAASSPMVQVPNGHCRANLVANHKWQKPFFSMPTSLALRPMVCRSTLARSKPALTRGMLQWVRRRTFSIPCLATASR